MNRRSFLKTVGAAISGGVGFLTTGEAKGDLAGKVLMQNGGCIPAMKKEIGCIWVSDGRPWVMTDQGWMEIPATKWEIKHE